MSDFDVGDAPLLTYTLSDASTVPPTPVDGTVVLTVTSPTGVVTTPSVDHPAVGAYRANVLLSSAGLWTARWVATGVGPVPSDAEVVHLFAVDPAMASEAQSRPAWAPELREVAVHIPTRTRSVTTDDPLGTFTDDTTPDAGEVTALIRHACALVLGTMGVPVVPVAYRLTGLAAALWAAYWIELAYPERDADLKIYDRLRTDADAATKAAALLNTAAGGGAVTDPTPSDTLLGSHTFPAAPFYADAPAGTIW